MLQFTYNYVYIPRLYDALPDEVRAIRGYKNMWQRAALKKFDYANRFNSPEEYFAV